MIGVLRWPHGGWRAGPALTRSRSSLLLHDLSSFAPRRRPSARRRRTSSALLPPNISSLVAAAQTVVLQLLVPAVEAPVEVSLRPPSAAALRPADAGRETVRPSAAPFTTVQRLGQLGELAAPLLATASAAGTPWPPARVLALGRDEVALTGRRVHGAVLAACPTADRSHGGGDGVLERRPAVSLACSFSSQEPHG